VIDFTKLKELATGMGGSMAVMSRVLDDPKFHVWTGSTGSHHYGNGGLAAHTFEVINLCLVSNIALATTNKNVDPLQLFYAALFHDIGKTYDYTPVSGDLREWTTTSHYKNVGHLTRSALIWSEVAGDYKDKEDVLHAILAHHNLREWGSPAQPHSRLAWILHTCDQMSARTDEYR